MFHVNRLYGHTLGTSKPSAKPINRITPFLPTTHPPAGAGVGTSRCASEEQTRPVAGGWFSRLLAWFRLPDFDECRDSVDDMEFDETCLDCGASMIRCRCGGGDA